MAYTPNTKNVLYDAKGDILIGSADNTAGRLAVSGTNGRVLAEDSSQTLGAKWAPLRPFSNPLAPAGALAESIPRQFIPVGNVAAPATGALLLVAMPVTPGDVITNVTFESRTTPAGTPTNWWFGLWDQSRVSLKYTADQTSTAWAANTSKTVALTSTYTIPASVFWLYAGFVMAATTVVSFGGMTQSTALLNTLPPILVGTPTSGTGSTGLTTPASYGAVGTTAGSLTASSAGTPYVYLS